MAESIKSTDADGEQPEQNIFDGKTEGPEIQLFDMFGKACEDNGIELSIAIILDKNGKPKVFYKGHIMDIATLLATVLREMKMQIFELLHTD